MYPYVYWVLPSLILYRYLISLYPYLYPTFISTLSLLVPLPPTPSPHRIFNLSHLISHYIARKPSPSLSPSSFPPSSLSIPPPSLPLSLLLPSPPLILSSQIQYRRNPWLQTYFAKRQQNFSDKPNKSNATGRVLLCWLERRRNGKANIHFKSRTIW